MTNRPITTLSGVLIGMALLVAIGADGPNTPLDVRAGGTGRAAPTGIPNFSGNNPPTMIAPGSGVTTALGTNVNAENGFPALGTSGILPNARLDSDLQTWAGLTPSPFFQTLVTADGVIAFRGLIGAEAAVSVNVMNYAGVDPTGATDSTSGFNLAVAAVSSTGGTINIPNGTFIIQGVNLMPGVFFRGQGCAKDNGSFADNAPTILRLPVSPTANVPMFRVPKGTVLDEFLGGGFSDIMFIGNGTAERPSGFDENRLDCINFAVWQRQAATVVAATDVWTSTDHQLSTADPVHFNNIGGALPALNSGTFNSDWTYYVRRLSADTFSVHPSANDATNNTNAVNFTGTGTGTHYVGRCCRNVWNLKIAHCLIRQFNIGVRGGTFSCNNTALAHSQIIYCGAGAWMTEHFHPDNLEINACHVAITGRFHDGRFNQIIGTANTWGIVPWLTVNGQPFQTDVSATDITNDSVINNSHFSGVHFWRTVNTAIRLGSNNMIVGGRCDGDPADTNSIGIEVQGNDNQITGVGFGSDSLNFGIGAAVIDTSGGKTHYGTTFTGCNFYHTGRTGITVRDSLTGAVAGGAVGYVQGVSAIGCTFDSAGGRCVDFRSNNGFPWGCNFASNQIIRRADLSATMSSSTDGLFEGPFYRCSFACNSVRSAQSAKYYLIKNTVTQDTETTYLGNRCEGLTGVTNLTFSINSSPLSRHYANTPSDNDRLTIQAGTGTASSDAVTINKPAGVITTESKSTAAGSTYTITLTCNAIVAGSIVTANLTNGGNGQAVLINTTPGSSSCTFVVKNDHASDAFNSAHKISYQVVTPGT